MKAWSLDSSLEACLIAWSTFSSVLIAWFLVVNRRIYECIRSATPIYCSCVVCGIKMSVKSPSQMEVQGTLRWLLSLTASSRLGLNMRGCGNNLGEGQGIRGIVQSIFVPSWLAISTRITACPHVLWGCGWYEYTCSLPGLRKSGWYMCMCISIVHQSTWSGQCRLSPLY